MAHGLKLGRRPYTKDKRDLKFERYFDLEKLAAQVPAEVGHEDKMPQPRLMLGNGPDDSVEPGFGGAGDCVFAWIANTIRLAHGIAGTKVNITGKEAISGYSEVTGYVIGDDSTDQGTDMRQALDWWVKTGFADADGTRHKLGAYLAIDPAKMDPLFWQAVYQLDVGVGLGINFPDSAMQQFDQDKPWAPVKGAQIDGGHAILLDAKRKPNPKVESWARDQEATVDFLKEYTEEAWAVLTTEMLVEGKTPEGLDLAALQADLNAL